MRDASARRANKSASREAALRFGVEYFDGTREQGYGGYTYDGRWCAVARRLVEHFDLKSGDRILDIGCAKGFFVADLMAEYPELAAYGLDISAYALARSHPGASGRLVRGSCDRLPFADGAFAAAIAINSIHNLELDGCLRALREIERVAPGRGFVQVDAYRSVEERELFLNWMLTAKTHGTPGEWLRIFESAGYTGEYYWTILEKG